MKRRRAKHLRFLYRHKSGLPSTPYVLPDPDISSDKNLPQNHGKAYIFPNRSQRLSYWSHDIESRRQPPGLLRNKL